MTFWQSVLRILDTQMTRPESYGWFHILFIVLSVAAGVLLCVFFKDTQRYAKRVMLITALIVIALEIYKLINYSFSYEEGITADFPWYVFPWQFCSTPMYVGLLAGLSRGWFHRSMAAYLATFALFAGICVMVYPNDVFIGTVGINIQTMICHGSMVSIGIYLLGSGYVPAQHRTVLRAVPVFAAAVGVAMVLNEIAYRTGLLETDNFNMFYISPHQDPHLPVYSIVQEHVAYPWCLFIYILGFSLAAGIVLLLAAGVRMLVCKRKAKT